MTFTDAEEITDAIKAIIRSEIKDDGLLHDVVMFIPSFRLEDDFDLPLVWLHEHPTTLVKDTVNFNSVLQVVTPYEFVCACFDEDIGVAEIDCKNLAWRVGKTLLKNRRATLDGKPIFNNIQFKTMYPVGEIEIQSKLNRVSATSIIFDIQYSLQFSTEKQPIQTYKRVKTDVETEVVLDTEYYKRKHS